jgi:hypothetical protein
VLLPYNFSFYLFPADVHILLFHSNENQVGNLPAQKNLQSQIWVEEIGTIYSVSKNYSHRLHLLREE